MQRAPEFAARFSFSRKARTTTSVHKTYRRSHRGERVTPNVARVMQVTQHA